MNRDRYKSLNHFSGKALDGIPHPKAQKALQCKPCGHAIARAICVVCYIPLCRRHMKNVDGQTFCVDHVPGYQE